ncbi:MAG: YraN family protein [Alphaproteobacteria bacterium]
MQPQPITVPSHTAAKQARINAYNKGVAAEGQAASMLAGQGYEILSRRYRSPAGEIDLVAAKGGHLAFVEVKARRTRNDAAWAITPRQQRRIADAAGYWLQNYPEYENCDMSFDAILVSPRNPTEHIQDAFRI